MAQVKASFAGNGRSLVKNDNVGLGNLRGSLRARRENTICGVATLVKGLPFPADCALHLVFSRLAESINQCATLH